MNTQVSSFAPAPISDGRVVVGGKAYMPDAKGSLTPVELIKPQHQLEDETVRKVFGFAIALSDQVSRFKEHTYEDLGAFDAILAQEYDVKKGGAKGNRTYQTFDGLMKIEVRVADLIDFGPELQTAKSLIDECLVEWSADTRPEIQAIITRAFNTDKEGQVNRSEIFMLLRLNIDDPRWKRAMEAIQAAMRTIGSKTYYRLQQRDSFDAPWRTVSIDLAKA